MLGEVEKMKKKVEKIESVYLEQLHYEKMIALKWKILAIVFLCATLISNIIWISVWNDAVYVEEILTEEIVTTVIEQGDGTNTISEVDINGTTNNSY